MAAGAKDFPAHTPWDGSHKAFSIGLQQLDLRNWIEVDAALGGYLAEKEKLIGEIPQEVFQAEPGTSDAQAEALELLAEFLPRRFPETYRREGDIMHILPLARQITLSGTDAPPLLTAARLIQEDLVLMQRSQQGWRLAAASLCFPSSWSLQEKFSLPLQIVHRNVPGFGPESRNAGLIDRIFDNLQPEQPVWRANWSLYPDAELYHGRPKSRRFAEGGDVPVENPFIRVEYQTLRKLLRTGEILFTIRIHVDPLRILSSHRDCTKLAERFRQSVLALDEAQLAYKGLVESRDALAERLARMAASGE